ncbi:MAG: quinone-dependent dihydroorotate dehydrogenase [Aestuariivirgaceae bacterium]|nr:quinone-dependent dihydroorotate dehydrogenase [Aestuariivirgaceae bacterium]
MLPYALIRPVLFALDAERAHNLALKALKLGLVPALGVKPDAALAVELFGLRFANPVGLAAGFDKNAEAVEAIARLGFGFVEVGSLTPKPQAGNPKPRMFRLADDRAVINRLGFNNQGHAAALQRLRGKRAKCVLGVNVGANKDATDRMADYALGLSTFNDVADYLTVNISSPNTPGLRTLQSRAELESLLARIADTRAKITDPKPVLLKIAPDLEQAELEDIARLTESGAVDGIIISNTTITRPEYLRASNKGETGGLSGTPLFELSTRKLAALAQLTKLPLIGVGGVCDAETAWQKLRAGASLIQLYSALTYGGPGLVAEILTGLAARLRREGFAHVSEVTGTGIADWS